MNQHPPPPKDRDMVGLTISIPWVINVIKKLFRRRNERNKKVRR